MKKWKKLTNLLLALVMCLSLTACGDSNGEDEGRGDLITDDDVSGADWRTTGTWIDAGTITRDGEDTDVLVCVHESDAAFYYDTEDQELFSSVDYPITLEGDVWEMFQYIDFSDLNGDGNSDVTLDFNDGDNEFLMVWFWDTESGMFMYQPDESWPGEDEGRGDLIPDDEGQGDLIPEDGAAVPVLMGGAFPFTNMETLQAENYKDGTYYYADVTEDGLTIVVNTVLPHDSAYDVQTLEDYLIDCALTLGEADANSLETVEENDTYTANMTYPVYIVTYTTGQNEDTREWTVFVMDTDSYTYLYGFGTTIDAVDDEMKSIYQDIFAGLYLSDEE